MRNKKKVPKKKQGVAVKVSRQAVIKLLTKKPKPKPNKVGRKALPAARRKVATSVSIDAASLKKLKKRLKQRGMTVSGFFQACAALELEG